MLAKFSSKKILILVLVLTIASAALAGPMIRVSERGFDFGRICQHATVSHRFWIENIGDETLRITKVVPGCGCTKAPLLDSTLAPGQKTPLDISFSTKSYRGFVKKVPYLETNIGENKVYMAIESELLPSPETATPIFVRPYKVDVSQYRPTPLRTKAKFYIHNTDSVDYNLTLIDHADHVFEVEMPESAPAGDSVRVVIKLHDDAVESEFEHSLTFAIDNADSTRYSVPVKRYLRVKDRSN